MNTNWVLPAFYAVTAAGFVLLGVALCYLPGALKRAKVERSLVVAERTAHAARTKGFVALEDPTEDDEEFGDPLYDLAGIFGHPAPFSESEMEVIAEAHARLVDPPTSRPYITRSAP